MSKSKSVFLLLLGAIGVTVGAFFSLNLLKIEAPGPGSSSASNPITSASANAAAKSASQSDHDRGITTSTATAGTSALQVNTELQTAFGQSAPLRPAASGEKILVTTSLRTTAYTHTEADHIKYGKKTALGTDLRYTPEYHSVAADWSRFPLGTKFRMQGVDRLFVVDDYGKALVGSRTVDIYFPSKRQMNHWGVRNVDIDVVEFGNFHESRKILAGRGNYPHCLEMLSSMTRDDWWKDFR